MDLVVLAGGMGSRFGGLKQMQPIDNEGNFIIDYSVFDAIKAGFDRVVFIIKEEFFEDFKNTIGKRLEGKIKVDYAFQKNELPYGYNFPKDRVKPFGTGHALLSCKDIVKGKFAIINADDFYGYDAFKTIYDFLKNNNDENKFGLIGYQAQNTLSKSGSVKRGICELNNNYLETIVESSIIEKEGKVYAKDISTVEEKEYVEIDRNQLVSMNMFGFTQKMFDALEKDFKEFLNENKNNLSTVEFLMPSVVNKLIQNNEVKTEVLSTSAKWFGITYKEDLNEFLDNLNNEKIAKKYPKNLWENN